MRGVNDRTYQENNRNCGKTVGLRIVSQPCMCRFGRQFWPVFRIPADVPPSTPLVLLSGNYLIEYKESPRLRPTVFRSIFPCVVSHPDGKLRPPRFYRISRTVPWSQSGRPLPSPHSSEVG